MIAILLLLITAMPATAAPSCGDRLQGYTVFEELVEGKIQMKQSVYPLGDWSDASAFDGVVIHSSTSAILDVVLRRQNKRLVKRYEFATWELDPAYSRASGFAPKNLFKDASSGDSFTFRLKENGEAICEDTYEIQGD